MRKIVLVFFALLLCGGANLFGQDATGRVIGIVTDPSGAAIPGVKVTVTNTGTQVARDTTTDQNGYYQVLDVPIGFYSVTAESSGFSKAVTDARQLFINQSLRIDIKLAVGAVSETVKVEGQATNVETVNATLGQSVTTRPIQNLPLNGRNVLDLALLQPGVSENNLSTPTNPRPSTGTFSVAGGRSDSVTYLLDGGLNNNLLSNNVVLNPNPDTIAEFRILTSNYTAEYGRNGAGVVSVVTKSGTNDYHGSLFEYVRNDFFNANLFFNNANRIGTPVLKRNQFGATAGGPITIPKIISGKDRFFFFIGYQGQRQVQQQQNPSVTVFTPAELKGDFSHSVRGGPDPGVVSFLQKFPYYQSNPALAAQAIVDPSRINSITQNYIKANLIPTSPTGVLFPQAGATNDRDELTEKVDFVVTPNDRISATLGSNRNPQIIPFSAESNVPGFPTTNNAHNYFGNIAYTRVFTPNLLNEVRVTAQRQNTLQLAPAVKLPFPAELGFKTISDDPTGPPQLRLNSGLRIGFSRNGPTTLIDNTYGFADNLTWTRGVHTLKAGFFYSPYQDNTVYDFYIDGRFRFLGTSGKSSKNDRADVLFGLPDTYLQFPKAPSNIRSHSYAGFAQDEWHVRRNLTFTLGVRYEYNSPKLDTQGRSFSVIPGLQSQRFVNAPLGLVFPGDPGAPKGANFPDKNDWAPRFGFAWSPGTSGKTSIRGGFGIFYDVLKGEDNLQFNGQAPFFGFASFTIPTITANPASEPKNFADPFGVRNLPNPFPSRPPARDLNFEDAGFSPIGDGGVFFVDPHLRTPYTYQYNLSVQRELINNLIAELNYVGSDSHKLTILQDSNPFIPGTNRRLLDTRSGDRPYSFLDTFTNLGNANYNSLQASLTKRFSDSLIGGTFFTFAYTYGHSIDNGSGFRQVTSSNVSYYNHGMFRASSDFDIRHRVVFSGGWDLPFDRMWQSGPKRLTKGWSLYPILSSRTGFPFDINSQLVRDSDTPGPSGTGEQEVVRANFTGGKIQIRNPRDPGNFFLNPQQFSVPTSGFGTLPRNSFRGIARTNFDLTVAKTTDIFRERVKAEFRADFFNVLNHTQFFEADNNIANGTFGQVSQTWDPRIIQLALRVTF
jgi:hypothetical protein